MVKVDNSDVNVHALRLKMSSPSQSVSIQVARDTSKSTLHYLPCKVECKAEGETPKDSSSERGRREARVDCFFEPVIREGNGTVRLNKEPSQQVLTATFRGRPLKGVEVNVPEGYRGVVLREQGTLSHDSQVLSENQ